MIDMLSSFPSPCGNEEILKKYIMKKYPVDWCEDSIGNLIYHKKGTGPKIMIYCGIDEDGFLVMNSDGTKLNFNHFGNRKIYPGTVVSFGGYKGEICSDNKEDPLKDQYIKLISNYDIKPGQNAVSDFEFYQDDDLIYAKEAAKRIALCAILNSLDIDTDKDIYFVLGVQGNNSFKGLINATNTILPEKVYAFEETTMDEMTYLLYSSGYVASENVKKHFNNIIAKIDFLLIPEVDSEKKSSAPYFNSPETYVFGIPVKFSESLRQTSNVKYIDKVSNIIILILHQED